MSVRILTGDCRTLLASLDAESVQCCVTSPPYFGLRDYGVAGQIGLEQTPDAYVAELVAVFREVRRVLREDGTLWLNLGDSYVAAPKGPGGDDKSTLSPTGVTHQRVKSPTSKQATNAAADFHGAPNRKSFGLASKNLIGIPWRVALALQADGWVLRCDVVWNKPTCMPESVTDRPTRSHEYLFLLAKSPRYYYDADAVAEPVAESSVARLSQPTLNEQAGSARANAGGKTNGAMKAVGSIETRNRRSVWTVAPAGYRDAHFATFPPALIEPCILAGSKRGDTVLDPFGGAGTTGLVADRLGRDAVLVELNPDYAAMARSRITDDAPLFADGAA